MRWILFAPLFLIGCSGDPDPTEPGAGTPTGELVSVDIVAAEGGTVATGEASLDIPAGALAADTTITVEAVGTSALPDSAALVGVAYDFGPDGTTFSTPATLTIDAGSAAPADKTYVVAWLDEAAGAWVDLPSTVSGATVSAPVEHFTTFVIRVVDASLPEDEVCDFSACGGDPTGSWTIGGVCLHEELPGEEECPEATAEMTLDQTGTYDLLADGTYTYDVVFELTFTTTWPASCLTGLSTCEDLGNFSSSCVGDPSVECICTSSITDEDQGGGTWTVAGTTVSFDEDADGEEIDTFDFCVEGDVFKISDPEGIQAFERP